MQQVDFIGHISQRAQHAAAEKVLQEPTQARLPGAHQRQQAGGTSGQTMPTKNVKASLYL